MLTLPYVGRDIVHDMPTRREKSRQEREAQQDRNLTKKIARHRTHRWESAVNRCFVATKPSSSMAMLSVGDVALRLLKSASIAAHASCIELFIHDISHFHTCSGWRILDLLT